MKVLADLACKIIETHKPPYHDKVLTTGELFGNEMYQLPGYCLGFSYNLVLYVWSINEHGNMEFLYLMAQIHLDHQENFHQNEKEW